MSKQTGADNIFTAVIHMDEKTPHTYITKLVQKGTDLATVMELAGHSNIKQTMEYVHIEFNSKVKAVESLEYLFM